MPKPVYRLIYNQDCTYLFMTTKEFIEPRHVEKMVDEVADGGADVMLINPSSQRVCYPSKVWQTLWDGYEPGKREFFGPIPENEYAAREHWVGQMARLAAQDCNYLTCALQRCRMRGITPGVSVRMNDMHDAPRPGTHLFSRFHMEHPELHLSNPKHLGWGAMGLNYAHEAVRQHYLSLIRELVTEYDFDVLELDFLRFANYFPRGHFAEHCTIMTGFIRKVREVLNASGRSITLIPRVAATPAAAKELGFEVATWAREGLVDAVTIGMFLNTGWEMPVKAFRALVGDDVGIYACADASADQRNGLPVRSLPLNAEMMRGFAAGYLAAGADGIYFFNFFCTREEEYSKDPLFAVFADLKRLDSLRGKDKTYLLTAGTSLCETDPPVQVPVDVDPKQTRGFEMLLAAEPETARVETMVVFEGNAVAEQLWLQVNDVPVGSALEVQDGPEGRRQTRTAIFLVQATALHNGRNRIVFRNEGEALTVLGVEVRVH